jgi:hypothetical protein
LLAETHPHLAERIAAMPRSRLALLRQHLQERPRPEADHGLSEEEVALVGEVGGDLLTKARFLGLARRLLAERFRDDRPDLAWKLQHLSLLQVECLRRQFH